MPGPPLLIMYRLRTFMLVVPGPPTNSNLHIWGGNKPEGCVFQLRTFSHLEAYKFSLVSPPQWLFPNLLFPNGCSPLEAAALLNQPQPLQHLTASPLTSVFVANTLRAFLSLLPVCSHIENHFCWILSKFSRPCVRRVFRFFSLLFSFEN